METIFNNINNKEKIKLFSLLKSHSYFAPKDKDITFIAKDKNTLCIIDKGSVRISKTDQTGNTILIEEIFEGDIFGSALSNLNSNYLIETLEDTHLYLVDFDYIIRKNEFKYSYYNEFIKNLLIIYQEKIENNNDRIEILTNKTIRDKLLSYFNIMIRGKNTRTLYLPFSFSSLADFLAINRSAMSREISNMKEEGLIEVKGRKIKLLYYI